MSPASPIAPIYSKHITEFCTHLVPICTANKKFCTAPPPKLLKKINRGGWRHASLPNCSDLLRNSLEILYSFCTAKKNYVPPLIKTYRRGQKISSLPNCSDLLRNGLKILYSFCTLLSVSYTHLTLPTIYSV